jgi:uncharacterized membrane protein (UPF0182 family)
MAGWLAARNDAPNYGQLVVFTFPKGEQVDSPQQIEAKIDNDPYISQWFTLRCQEGSFCIRGNLLVIPIVSGDDFGLLYAEPVYLQAEGIDFPELKQVILATGAKVVMEASIPEALAALTGYSPTAATEPVEDQKPTTARPEAPASEVEAVVDSISEALDGFKASLSALEEALDRLRQSMGGQE